MGNAQRIVDVKPIEGRGIAYCPGCKKNTDQYVSSVSWTGALTVDDDLLRIERAVLLWRCEGCEELIDRTLEQSLGLVVAYNAAA